MSRVTRPAGPPSVADEPRYQNQQQLHLDRRRTRRVRNHIFGPCLVPKNFANTTDILRWTTLVPPWTNAERNGRSKHGFSFSWCDHAEGPPSCSSLFAVPSPIGRHTSPRRHAPDEDRPFLLRDQGVITATPDFGVDRRQRSGRSGAATAPGPHVALPSERSN